VLCDSFKLSIEVLRRVGVGDRGAFYMGRGGGDVKYFVNLEVPALEDRRPSENIPETPRVTYPSPVMTWYYVDLSSTFRHKKQFLQFCGERLVCGGSLAVQNHPL
jgi:hypothetical protein